MSTIKPIFLEYPISVIGLEYWKSKPAFRANKGSYNMWTMIALESGKFSFEIGGEAGEAVPGDIVFIPPNTEFCRNVLAPISFFLSCFYYQDVENSNEERIIYLLRELFGYKFTSTEQDRLHNNFRHLLTIYDKGDWINQRYLTHFICDIWSLFCMEAESLVQYRNILQDPLMKAAKDWIDQQAYSDIQMKEIAKKLKLNPSQFTQRFQIVFGLSPSRYLFALRMERAKTLLIQTDYKMQHIAELCGYNNGFYFSRMFTQYAKMNPSIFRKIHALPSP